MNTLQLQVTYSFCVTDLHLDPGWTLYNLSRDLYLNTPYLPARHSTDREHDDGHYEALRNACYRTLRFTPYLEDRACTLRITDRLLIIRFSPVSTGFQNDPDPIPRQHPAVSRLRNARTPAKPG